MVDKRGIPPPVRDELRKVLQEFGVTRASRATTTDLTEEVILVSARDFDAVDVMALTIALMRALPHTKVWVAKQHSRWISEPL